MRLCLVVFLALPSLIESFGEADRYLIVTSPETGHIAYQKLSSVGLSSPLQTLIGNGLSRPQGIAVDQYRKHLFVADPDLSLLVAYPLLRNFWNGSLAVGKRFTVAEGVVTRAVSVDPIGNVYFTDEANHRIYRVTAKMIADGVLTPTVIYDGRNGTDPNLVHSPGGVAVDGFFAYWLNKGNGTANGSLVRGPQDSNMTTVSDSLSLKHLASNPKKSYSLCLARGNVFYTEAQKNILGKRAGELPVIVSSALKEPRGCAFDGDATIYVADKALNAVYQFPVDANLRPARLSKVAAFQGAYGLSVYTHIIA